MLMKGGFPTNPFKPKGQILAQDGTQTLPGMAFAAQPSFGFWRNGTTQFQAVLSAGNIALAFTTGGIRIPSDKAIEFSQNTNNSGLEFSLLRDAADTLAQRRGANPQTLRLYNTFTDTSNYERGSIGWATNVLVITTEKLGTGAARALDVKSGLWLALRSAAGQTMYVDSDIINFRNVGTQTRWAIDTNSAVSSLYAVGSNSTFSHGASALATNATAGFLMLNSCAGVPSGTPASIPTGQIPLVIDSTNLKLYAYIGGAWKSVTLA